MRAEAGDASDVPVVRVKVGSERAPNHNRELLYIPVAKACFETANVAENEKQPALATLCGKSFLRSKRKTEAEHIRNGYTSHSKVIKIDDDLRSSSAATLRPPTFPGGTELPSRSLRGMDERAVRADERSVMPTSGDSGPRVEIINGQIVLKESSLMIANQDSALADAECEYEEVEEGVHASSRYSSFLKKQKSSRWSLEETRSFYMALQQCGTEFSVMESFLPGRTRKELKMKFFREENQHPELVKRALESSVPLDLEAVLDEKSEQKIGQR